MSTPYQPFDQADADNVAALNAEIERLRNALMAAREWIRGGRECDHELETTIDAALAQDGGA